MVRRLSAAICSESLCFLDFKVALIGVTSVSIYTCVLLHYLEINIILEREVNVF